jgi:hypothetical protein
LLIASLKANKSDEKIKSILKECKEKGLKAGYLTGKVRKETDESAAMKVKILM